MRDRRAFGYAREELVAELGAIILVKHFGLASDYGKRQFSPYDGANGISPSAGCTRVPTAALGRLDT